MTRVLVISWPVDSEELVNSFLGDGVVGHWHFSLVNWANQSSFKISSLKIDILVNKNL